MLRLCFYTTLPFQSLMSFQRHLFAQDNWDHTTLGLSTYDVVQACHSHHPILPRPLIFTLSHTLNPTFVIQSHGPPSCPTMGDKYWQKASPEKADDNATPLARLPLHQFWHVWVRLAAITKISSVAYSVPYQASVSSCSARWRIASASCDLIFLWLGPSCIYSVCTRPESL